MAISYVAGSTLVSGTGARNISKPTGVLEDDIMLMVMCVNQVASTPVVPGDWTPVDSETGDYGIYIYSKVAGAAEGTEYEVNATASGSYTPGIFAFRTDTADPLQVDASATQTNASSTNRESPSVVATEANTYLMCAASLQTNFASTPDAAMTERADTGSNPRMHVMTQAIADAGATGTRTATGAGASASKTASVLIKEGTSGPPPLVAPTGLTAAAQSENDILLTWTDNNTLFDGISIERSPDGTGSWVEISTVADGVQTYTDVNLNPGTQYFYRIRAFRNDV